MRRIIGGVFVAAVCGLGGCGDSSPTIPSDKLAKVQDEEQKQADDAERAMLKQTQPAKKK